MVEIELKNIIDIFVSIKFGLLCLEIMTCDFIFDPICIDIFPVRNEICHVRQTKSNLLAENKHFNSMINSE